MTHRGSCHCGAVEFEVDLPNEVVVYECNCSICSKGGFVQIIVPASKFELIEGAQSLQTYTFNTGVAKHTFCKVCGIKPFYTPRSNPDGISINYRCLDTKPSDVTFEQFDGQNWEAHAASLSHLSK